MADNTEQKQVRGWVDVVITPDMPLSVIINFLNVINERLCAIEDVTQVPFNNKMISLTELYRIQAEQQAAAAAKAKEGADSDQPAESDGEERA